MKKEQGKQNPLTLILSPEGRGVKVPSPLVGEG